MASGFKINKQGVRKMAREIEREMNKELRRRPVRVPIETETNFSDVNPLGGFPPASTVNNYNGPIITMSGDHAQIAWNVSGNVEQYQEDFETVTTGYEALARVIADLRAGLEHLSLDENQVDEARASSDIVLGEVVKDNPDVGVIKRAVNILRGILAPVALGIRQGASEETAELTRKTIEELGNAAGF